MPDAVSGLIQEHLATLRQVFPKASITALPDGSLLVTVPEVNLPPGWSQTTTTVYFVVPVGYPMARPDCFWADSTLRLAGGGMPTNAGVNTIPGTTEPRLWFSWHVSAWNPASDGLLTYMRVIQRRLMQPR